MIFVFLNKACLQVFTVSKCYGHTMEVRTRGRTITEINSRIVSNWHHYLPSQTKYFLLFPFSIEFGLWKMYSVWNFNLCTFDLYGPMCNAFYAGSIHYKGKWEGVGPWKSRVFWVLWNGIEPIGECHLGHRFKVCCATPDTAIAVPPRRGWPSFQKLVRKNPLKTLGKGLPHHKRCVFFQGSVSCILYVQQQVNACEPI